MRVQAINPQVLRLGFYKNQSFMGIRSVRTVDLPYDTVSFKGRDTKLLSQQEGAEAANKLRTSTSGYRATYGEKFNDQFVYSMTHALAEEMQDKGQSTTLVGGDTRQATQKYAPEITDIFNKEGIDVIIPQLEGAQANEISPVASPVLALITKEYELPLSVLLTASHNPWSDGGYNFLTDEGSVADDKTVKPLADRLERITAEGEFKPKDTEYVGKKISIDPYQIYKEYLDEKGFVDFENIKNAGIDIFYEDFGGTGKYYFPKLMKDNGIELKKELSSEAEGPNPVSKNLQNLAEEVKKSDNPLKIGLANDGDSDRFGVIDENGNFITAPDVIMLCAYHLIKNKGMTSGTIIKNDATSNKIDAMAEYMNKQGYDIEVEQTPVGFKFLGGKMIEISDSDKPVIVAGEESGGLTIRGHIPEKDGYLALATLLDLVATEQRPIGEILEEINTNIGGNYYSNCVNMKFATEEEKENAVKYFEKYFNGDEDKIAGMNIDYPKTHGVDAHLREYKPNGDGLKFYLEDGSCVFVRKSGTEPVLRLYIDAVSEETGKYLENYLVDTVKGIGGTIKA